MGKLLLCKWPTKSLRRHEPSADGTYYAYIPDKLTDQTFQFREEVTRSLGEANAALRRLDKTASILTNNELLARIALRTEAVTSSDVERLSVSPKRLFLASLARAEGRRIEDAIAGDILESIDAMAEEVYETTGPITIERIRGLHRRLLLNTDKARHAGTIRNRQNVIRRTDNTKFYPPPPDQLPELLNDLVHFCNDEGPDPITQAALAHAYLADIHPFGDGNGRAARSLTYMVLRNRGLTTRAALPLWLVCAPVYRTYIRGLIGTTYVGPPSAPASVKAIEDWIVFFSSACIRASQYADAFEFRVMQLQARWRASLDVDSYSPAFRVLAGLSKMPILTVRRATEVLAITPEAARIGVEQLVEANVLTPVSVTQGEDMFEARELIEAFTDYEAPARERVLIRRLRKPQFGDAVFNDRGVNGLR